VTQKLRSAVGLGVTDLVPELVATHQDLDLIFFCEPGLRLPLQSRPRLSEMDRRTIRHASELGYKQGLPLWDSVMLFLIRAEEVSDQILSEALFHQAISKKAFSLTQRVFNVQALRELEQQVPAGKMLSLCSEVRLKDGATKHIPMMDFYCPVNQHSLDLACGAAKLFGVGGGFVVETERSYHFYGTELLTISELTKFLGRALLFAPIVDRAWIAHQLIDMCCNLRIGSPRPNGIVPTVVRVVE
jgi:hypothetical protein